MKKKMYLEKVKSWRASKMKSKNIRRKKIGAKQEEGVVLETGVLRVIPNTTLFVEVLNKSNIDKEVVVVGIDANKNELITSLVQTIPRLGGFFEFRINTIGTNRVNIGIGLSQGLFPNREIFVNVFGIEGGNFLAQRDMNLF